MPREKDPKGPPRATLIYYVRFLRDYNGVLTGVPYTVR